MLSEKKISIHIPCISCPECAEWYYVDDSFDVYDTFTLICRECRKTFLVEIIEPYIIKKEKK
jgi:hypothetical protein